MFALLYYVKAKPGRREELVDFLNWDCKVSNEQEEGTLLFNFLEDPENKNAFYVYEAYRDKAAFEQHKKNEPVQSFFSDLRNKFVIYDKTLFEGELLGGQYN